MTIYKNMFSDSSWLREQLRRDGEDIPDNVYLPPVKLPHSKFNNQKENNTMFNTNEINNEMNNTFTNMIGKIAPGMCRLSMTDGSIAVKTSSGYKTFNPDTGDLINCSQFALPIAEDLFFVLPTNHVEKGDIILIGGKPKCVIEPKKNTVVVQDYEDREVKEVRHERHIFMGEMYFYGKIVSFFFQNGANCLKGKKGMARMAQIMMMSQAAKSFTGNNNDGGFASMLPLMMLTGNNPFGNMFNFGTTKDKETEEEEVTPINNESKNLTEAISTLVNEIKSLKEVQLKQTEEIASLKKSTKKTSK